MATMILELRTRVEGMPTKRHAFCACLADGLSMTTAQLRVRAVQAGLRVEGRSREDVVRGLIAWAQERLSRERKTA